MNPSSTFLPSHWQRWYLALALRFAFPLLSASFVAFFLAVVALAPSLASAFRSLIYDGCLNSRLCDFGFAEGFPALSGNRLVGGYRCLVLHNKFPKYHLFLLLFLLSVFVYHQRQGLLKPPRLACARRRRLSHTQHPYPSISISLWVSDAACCPRGGHQALPSHS